MSKQYTAKLQSLMETGLTQEEALVQLINDEKQQTQTITNRIEWIKTLTTIKEVKRATHVAHSKKSKATNLDKKAKYQAEIDAGNNRLNELIAKAMNTPDPIQGLIDLGEDESSILHNWIRTRESYLKDAIKGLEGTMKDKKDLINKQSPSTPKSVKEELKKYGLLRLYEERVNRGDQGVVAINRKVRLMEKVGK